MRRAFALCLLLACRSATPPPVVALPSTPHGPGMPLETIALADRATSRTILARGELYLLRAEGVVTAGDHQQDAEFAFAAGGAPADAIGALDVGVDVGLRRVLPAAGRKPAPPSTERLKWFGTFRGDHVYYLIVPGAGAPLSLALVAPAAVIGRLALSLYRLSPAPPLLGGPLETLMVPARQKVAVRSAVRPASGAVYLLQSAGEVQVGGPGAMGDAEFHDYHADGRGFNEGEAGVDFGLGVDEEGPAPSSSGPGHPQRQRKWGAFRMDHTYYMLYAGTGAPITFLYHDSGGKSGVYKDNEGFLPVSIFAAP
jgi:hypothetical protein